MWQYLEIDLCDVGKRDDEIDLLNRAGSNGWELVAIIAPYRAILKRPVEDSTSRLPVGRTEASGIERTLERRPADVKFRDPTTGQTWSGRGRMATWLATKVAAGESADDYRVD